MNGRGSAPSPAMVSCKHCATPNCLDAAFCKRCGTALPEEDVREAQAKLDLLVAEGRAALGAGRVDEAFAVAETALANNPTMIEALSLLVDVHLRRDELTPALEAADKIVDLRPDSEIERIRRNGIRTRLTESLQPVPDSDRRFALLAAFCAVVAVVSIGAFAWRLTADRTQPVASTPVPAATVAANEPAPVTPVSTNPAPANPGTTNQLLPGDVPAIRDGGGDGSEAADPLPSPRPRSTGLPRLGDAGALPSPGDGNLEVSPISPGIPSGTIGVAATPVVKTPPRPRATDPDPKPDASGESKDPGEISISVRAGGPAPRSAGGGADVSGNGVQALLRSGSQMYQIGNYAGAAGAYEKALAGGADPLGTNQRLAMACAALGRTSDAVAAYGRAIAAGEAALASGRGDKDRVAGTVETCRAALRVLQGG